MEVKLSMGKIPLKDLTWGEENDCYEAADNYDGNIKISTFWRRVEQFSAGKSVDWINGLSRADGIKLRQAVKDKFNKAKSEDDKKK